MKPSLRILGGWLILMGLIALSCSSPVQLTLFATATPSATPTPPPTPTPTSTPTPTPTPTPLPAQRLQTGEGELFLGDYETARQEYQTALAAATESETQASAAVGIGKALFLEHNYSLAITQLKNTIGQYEKASALAEAWYFLGESYAAQKMYTEAADAYQHYLDLRPDILSGYVQEQRGDMLLAANDGSGSTNAYLSALKSPPPGDPVWIRLKLSQAYTAQKDYKSAITLLLDIYQNSTDDYAKAQADWLMGQTYLAMGIPEQAHARFQDAVINFPKSYDSYSGLVALVNDNVAVSDFNRGIVDYYAGQYSLCADALNRFLNQGKPEDGTAYYYRALCLRQINQLDGAVADFDALIKDYTSDRLRPSAFQEKAFTQWAYQDKFEDAANTMLTYSGQAGDAQDSADALYEAARTFERGGLLDKAAATWEQMINTYPTATNSYRGLFLAGVSYYRIKDYPQARTVFQRALLLASAADDQAAASLWIGKTYQAEGNTADAQKTWEQAVEKDPTGYYSERAAELLIDRQPFSALNPLDLGYDLNSERADAEAWLRTTFKIGNDVDLSGLGDLAKDPAFLRGEELYRLGRYSEARDEFETLRKAAASDPVQTYRLMSFFLERNLYRSAILCSRQILDLAGLDDAGTLRAPRFFNHIRFGVYFRNLVTDTAQKEQLNPLFLLSVLRQESLFEPFAQSGAGARGLMQIVPATGKEISTLLNWPPNYETDDLDRPLISIPFGAHYLAQQRDAFKGSLFDALAAYNGGPGNTAIWSDLANGDPDLFLEVIRADETRTYIMQIFEFYNLYRLIYEQKP